MPLHHPRPAFLSPFGGPICLRQVSLLGKLRQELLGEAGTTHGPGPWVPSPCTPKAGKGPRCACSPAGVKAAQGVQLQACRQSTKDMGCGAKHREVQR